MAPVVVFDVNETLLDLAGLDPHFERVFGREGVRERWFSQLLQLALVATVTESYRDFSELAGDALGAVAKQRKVGLGDEDKESILAAVKNLEPHPDVVPSLTRLRDAGFRLAALTNSPYKTLKGQLEHAGLSAFFEQALSVDEVQVFKPHRKVYEMAAGKLAVAPADLLMVAAHAWDTTGALRAGCRAAFLARPGKVLSPADETPDIVGATLAEVADHIIVQYS